MDNKDVKTLVEILKIKERTDLAGLLAHCLSEIEGSGQFGNFWNSTISTFVVYAPLRLYYKLKELKDEDKKIILDSVLDIHPLGDAKPEITSIEYRIQQEENQETPEIDYVYVGNTIRVFISYSSDDKILAGKIKYHLENHGLDVFLAHEDIEPSAEWQDVILENLDSTDIFMPILTINFTLSKWTDQESGVAFAKNKLIIPISTEGNNPYGFLGKIQALKFNLEDIEESCKKIINILHKNKRFEKAMLDSAIQSFANSASWATAGKKATVLLGFNQISNDQINTIARAATQNHQIYDSFNARSKLRILFSKHTNVDRELLNEYYVAAGERPPELANKFIPF